jgi:predicted flap endonuclease-1-like 5' DNA nuclease
MPYTLIKWILWLLLAALVGGVIGYLLRGLRPSAARRPVDRDALVGDDLDRLRRKANEAAVATADRNTAIAERDALKAECDALRSQLAECRALEAHRAPAGGQVHGLVAIPSLTDDDLARGAAVLGRPVRRDDLTVVEGIGPKIAELLHDAGVTTWHALAEHPLDELRGVLTAAGPRFQVHDPGTWPAQADLLRHGRWAEFQALTDRLDGGREPDA